MLNELHQIHRALLAAGHTIGESPHPDISSVQKGPLLHMRLDKDGRPATIEFRNGDGLLKIGDGNKNSFPAVRVQRPLLAMTSAQVEVFHKAKGDLWPRLKTACQLYGIDADRAKQWPGEGYRRRVKERFDGLKDLSGTDAEVILEAARRFHDATEKADTFLSHCIDVLAQQNLDRDQAKLVCDLWVGQVDAKTGKTKAACVLYFDVDSFEGYARDAADSDNFRDVTRAMAAASGAASSTAPVRCAVTGIPGKPFDGNFPRPNLGFLGPTLLYSKNDDAPTLERYRRNSNKAMCVTEETVSASRGAAAMIAHADREGKTWARIPSDLARDWDLLLAFVPAAPDVHVVGTVTAEGTDAPQFKEFASKVLDALLGRVSDQRAAEVLFYILRRVDTGNAKMVHSTTGSVGRLMDAAERWSGFCADHAV